MKIIDIENKTNYSSSNIIRWLNNSRPIKLEIAREISNKMKVPITIFEDANVQVKHLGKSYLQDNDTKHQDEKAIRRGAEC